jgi:hypothetical protein
MKASTPGKISSLSKFTFGFMTPNTKLRDTMNSDDKTPTTSANSLKEKNLYPYSKTPKHMKMGKIKEIISNCKVSTLSIKNASRMINVPLRSSRNSEEFEEAINLDIC